MVLLHNMSSAPRTSFEVKGRPLSRRVAVFSITYALAKSGAIETLIPTKKLKPSGVGDHFDIRDLILKHIAEPKDIFTKIGDPVYPDWPVDFLLGWTPVRWTNPDLYEVSTDPNLCAGVLSKCAGARNQANRSPDICSDDYQSRAHILYLAQRTPVLTWDRLLVLPVAFDEEFIKTS